MPCHSPDSTESMELRNYHRRGSRYSTSRAASCAKAATGQLPCGSRRPLSYCRHVMAIMKPVFSTSRDEVLRMARISNPERTFALAEHVPPIPNTSLSKTPPPFHLPSSSKTAHVTNANPHRFPHAMDKTDQPQGGQPVCGCINRRL